MNSFKISIPCPECGEIIGTVNFHPGSPPPPCSNPDSPAFSDSGSSPEISSYPEICPICNSSINEDYVFDYCNEDTMEQESKQYDLAHQYEPEDNWDEEDYWDSYDDREPDY